MNRQLRACTAILTFLTSLLLLPGAYADVRLPQLISNGMVLQRDRPLKLWGWASPGEKVRVNFNGKTGRTATGADGGPDGRSVRTGTPEDIASACSYLCSDEASYITGQVIGVNGGMYI